MRKGTALARALAMVFAAGMFADGVAAGEVAGKPPKPGASDLDNLPAIIFDESVGDWVVDRFVGNTMAGCRFYQGPAREIGGLQRPSGSMEAGDGTMYISFGITGSRTLAKITPDGTVRLVMEPEGLIEGPMEQCRSGKPVWNPKEKALYLLGPNCLRKVVEKPDGSRWVEVAFGVPGKAGKQDGPVKEATFPSQCRGVVCNAKGTFYWLQDFVLRRIEKGVVSTIPLKRSDGSRYIFHMIYGGMGLGLGENEDTLYVDDFYNTHAGYSILKCDVKTGELTRFCGRDPRAPASGALKKRFKQHHGETDGPRLTHVGFNSGARGFYHPFYNAFWLGSPDQSRFRWVRLDGDGWARTVFAARRPETKRQRFGMKERNSLGIPGEQVRWGSSCGLCGMDSKGGVYITANREQSGLWRAYNKNWQAYSKREVKP